jgi:hypothetical protein
LHFSSFVTFFWLLVLMLCFFVNLAIMNLYILAIEYC